MISQILTFNHAMEYCLKRLAACDVTQAALLLKLRQRGCPEAIALEATRVLCEKGYLNEQRSAERLVRMWRRGGKAGRGKLMMTLRQQGIDEALQQEALGSVSEDEELEFARNAFSHYRINYADMRWKEKALAYLVRRGFSLSTARKIVPEGPADPLFDLS